MTTKITISNKSQLYMKFLSDLQQVATGFNSRITIQKGEVIADAKSFIGILALIDAKGTKLEITAEGEDALMALDAIGNLAGQNYLKLNDKVPHFRQN